MHIIIIGCGKVGSKFAQVLSEEGHDVVIVDNDASAFRLLSPSFSGITVTGVPIDQDVLKQAGIEACDALAAVTPDDSVNIMTCQVAKEIFKVPRVIARIYDPSREHVFHQFGLETICPTNITVDVIRSIVLGETEVSTHTIGSNTINYKHLKIKDADGGKKLSSIKLRQDHFPFGIIKSGSFEFIRDPSLRVEKDDILVIAEKVD